jgi:uncharacterized protein
LTSCNRIFADYPRQQRLKILGRAEIFEGEKAKAWMDKVRDSRYKATPERVYVIHLEAFDWNCPQHIIPRFTEEEIREAVAPAETDAGFGAGKSTTRRGCASQQ